MLNKLQLGIRYLWGIVQWVTTDQTLGYIGQGLRVSEKLFGNESNKQVFEKAARVQDWLDVISKVRNNAVVAEIANQIDHSNDPDFKDYNAAVDPDKYGAGNDGVTIVLKDGKLSGTAEYGILKGGIDSDGTLTAGVRLGN